MDVKQCVVEWLRYQLSVPLIKQKYAKNLLQVFICGRETMDNITVMK